MARRKSIKKTDKDFEMFLVQVGEKLKKTRIAKGYSSYEQFAYDHEIGRAQYGKYERGTEDLRLSSLYKILNNMGLSFEEFFRGIKWMGGMGNGKWGMGNGKCLRDLRETSVSAVTTYGLQYSWVTKP